MKRGNVGIGLVILGVVAIIAVIGLVLLFTRASQPQGAASTDFSIGDSYGGGGAGYGAGIGQKYPTPQYQPGYTYPSGTGPQVAYPASPALYAGNTYGTRSPQFIVAGYTSIEDMYGCSNDLKQAGIPVPHNLFNCFALPVKGASEEVQGFYPPASSAYRRPETGDLGKIGGHMACFKNSVGAEGQISGDEDLTRDLLLLKLVDGDVSTAKYSWSATTYNGIRTPVCWVTSKNFPFPQ